VSAQVYPYVPSLVSSSARRRQAIVESFLSALGLELSLGDCPTRLPLKTWQLDRRTSSRTEAVDVSVFYGREEQLAQLRQWIVEDHCRLVAVWELAALVRWQ